MDHLQMIYEDFPINKILIFHSHWVENNNIVHSHWVLNGYLKHDFPKGILIIFLFYLHEFHLPSDYFPICALELISLW
jgi:hypothetical protein